jgi:epoxyqueuosine reductase
MGWLERNRERILDPGRILPGARSLLVVGLGHARAAVRTSDGGRIARYAAGRDYHNVIRRRLRKLARALGGRGLSGGSRAIVDAGPLLERSHAAEAGLGFASKAANLLHPRFGPWFFLGELLLEAEVEPTPFPPAGSCGTCTACLDACPTGAIREPGVVDSNLCLSYHTIENRGSVPHALRALLGDWVFGCDVCSEVCPWGERAPDSSERFGTHAAVEGSDLADWLRTPPERFGEIFRGSALQRARRDGLARNAALVLGARPSERGRDALLAALEDRSPRVREAAFWALARGHRDDALVRAALDRARGREPDPLARADMETTREQPAPKTAAARAVEIPRRTGVHGTRRSATPPGNGLGGSPGPV